MDPKSGDGRMMLAPGAGAGAASSYAFPGAERRPAPTPAALEPAFPRVDDHLVVPEVSREEVIRGRRIQTMGANPPHAEAHLRADFLIAPHVREGYVAASDLLTRASQGSNFATDVSIRKLGTDPQTGARYLEELSFEIVNEQTMRDVTEKAEDLIRRGVRRVFAIFVKAGKISEWSSEHNAFIPMDEEGIFEDPIFIRPIAVRALVDAAVAETEVVRALEKKGNPEIGRIRREGEDRGHKRGFNEGRRGFLLDLLRKRFSSVPATIEERVRMADDTQLDAWANRLFSASSLDELFGSNID